MKLKGIHYLSGLIISLFVCLHLFNHLISVEGAQKHIEVMQTLRGLYRNLFAETLLLMAVGTQIFTGISLFRQNRKTATSFFERVQLWSGLYLAIFFSIHLSAVFMGRLVLHLDTNFYFGVAGLNTFPINLFFIPYYSLAVLSFFGHIAAIHNKKMRASVLGMPPQLQSALILLIGVLVTAVILYGATNGLEGVEIPAEYNVIIGK